jgi:3-oxoadipate enol-lactonase
MDHVNINGIEIAYRMAGDASGAPIVLVHGYTGNARNWALSVKPLTGAGWRTLTADNPGHGASAGPDTQAVYTMESMADIQHGLAKQLGFAPAVFVGHSMGGAIVEELAIRHPGAVRALVLVDSAGGGPRDIAGWEQQRAAMERVREQARLHGVAAAWDYQVEHGMRPGFETLPKEMQELTRSEFVKTSLPGYLYCGEQLNARRHTLEDLAKLTVPTLVIRGIDEGAGLVKVADDLARTIPGAKYAVIPGAAHSPQMENPAAFNDVLGAFLAALA